MVTFSIKILLYHYLFYSKMYSLSPGFWQFYFNSGLQRLYTSTRIILQKTINGFLCLLIVFLKSKTYQLILKDVIKLNRNLPYLIEIKLLLAIRTKWYWLKSIYLIKVVLNLSSQQTVINDNRSS